ncbi:unnamed protein product, partial [Adineta steineri]
MTTKSKNDLPSPSSFEHLPDIVSQTNLTTDTLSFPITTTNQHDSRTSIDVIREMTCSSLLRQEYPNLTVLDVYDEAALIGKDFERIIEAYGTETIRDLVPKVIRILELLELQAAKNEKETDRLMEMKTRIERLEAEKNETRELRDKFDQELELIEDQWRKEADNLMALVSKLEDENRRLRDEIQHKNALDDKSNMPSPKETISLTREELQCIKNLTDENMKLKRTVKVKDKELTQKTFDMEAIFSLFRTTDETLKDYAIKFGEITDCLVMKDQKGQSKCFGFVTFINSEIVDEFMKQRPHIVDGRQIDPKRAMPREEANNDDVHLTVKKIFIGGIRDGLDEDTLRKHFEKYGNINDCLLMHDKNGKTRGFAFIEFDDYDSVDKVILARPHTIGKYHVDVKKAIPKDQ